MRPLDFLIIGAQKCATTSLFEQLRTHPDINMPLQKEVPFFTREDADRANWEAFSHEYFPEGTNGLWGKASPQYLADPQAAARIAALMPTVKLVVVLRDPRERSWSHYRMDLRRGTEHRPYAEVIEELLTDQGQAWSRSLPVPDHSNGFESESAFHVSWSEYGRCLEPFLEHFSREQLLVLYLEDLAAEPEVTLDRLLAFLGLPEGYRPPALGKVVHAGGNGNRIPHSARAWLRDRALVRHIWEAIPSERQGRMRFLYDRWNGAGQKGGTSGPDLPPELDAALAAHFARDLRRLLSADLAPPWIDRYADHLSVANCEYRKSGQLQFAF